MLIFQLKYAKFTFCFMKNMKKQLEYCLEGEHKKIDPQNGRNNQQQV